MSKMIKNLTNRPVYIHLNSTQLIALSPGEQSEKIRGVELVNNSSITKLKKKGIIKILSIREKNDKINKTKKTKKAKKQEITGKTVKATKKEETKEKTIIKESEGK